VDNTRKSGRSKRSISEGEDPFKDWDSYDPAPRMGEWRESHEQTILQALESERRLMAIRSILSSDTMKLCEDCQEMKCYGSLYPICEPVLKKLRGLI
jgi:hypothetical protein